MVDRCPQAEEPASAQDAEKEVCEVGRLLREARLAGGKEDLGCVARYLWVPLEHLNALEQGDLRHAPGHPDLLVLVRRYADHVGLDGSRLAQRLGTPSRQGGAPPRPSRRGLAHAPGVRLTLALGVTLLFTAAPVTGYRTGPEPLQSTTGDPVELTAPPSSVEQPDGPEPAAGSAASEVLVETGSPAPSLAHAGLPEAGAAAPAAQSGGALDSGLAAALMLELRSAAALRLQESALGSAVTWTWPRRAARGSPRHAPQRRSSPRGFRSRR